MAKKKTTRKPSVTRTAKGSRIKVTRRDGDYEISNLIPAAEIVTTRKGRTPYAGIISQMQALALNGQEGLAFEVKPPAGVTLPVFINRMTSLIQRRPVNPPEGLRFGLQKTVNGGVAFVLKQAKGRSRK